MNTIAEKIHLIEALSPSEEATVVLLDKIIQNLAQRQQEQLDGYHKKIKAYEEQYGMNTAEFQQQFNSGALGDEADWFEWDALADIATRLETRLSSLEPHGV